MDLKQAERDLFDDRIWFRGGRHRRALEFLTNSADPATVVVLAKALVNRHRRSKEIDGILRQLPNDPA